MIELIGLDADDTLWHNETNYTRTKKAFADLFAKYYDLQLTERKLDETEMRNIHIYGFGIKSFTLSMIETAIEITGGQVDSSEIQQIIDYSRQMLATEVELFDRVEDTLADLSQSHNLMLITKGDTFEQERKVSSSGIAHFFSHIEVVGQKTPQTYKSLLRKYNINPSRFLMVGNALKSDILPVLEIGGQAVYIHYEDTWAHENDVEHDPNHRAFYEIEDIGQLPALIESII